MPKEKIMSEKKTLTIKVDRQLYDGFSEIVRREGLKKMYMIDRLLDEKLREFVEGEL